MVGRYKQKSLSSPGIGGGAAEVRALGPGVALSSCCGTVLQQPAVLVGFSVSSLLRGLVPVFRLRPSACPFCGGLFVP